MKQEEEITGQKKEVIIEERIKLKVETSEIIMHIIGMILLTIGVYASLKGIYSPVLV